MLKNLCLTVALSTPLIFVIPKSGVCEPILRTLPQPTVSHEESDTPACYIQTTEGMTVNLSSMCGKKNVQPTIPCPEITDPERKAFFAQSCGNDASCLANLGCQQPPRPTYPSINGSPRG